MTQVLLNSNFFQASPSPIICQNKLIKLNYQGERESTLNMVWSKPSTVFIFNTLYKTVILCIVVTWKGENSLSNFSSHLFCLRLRKFRQSLTPSPPLPLLILPSCTTHTFKEAPWLTSPQSSQYSTLQDFSLKSSPLISSFPPFYQPRSPDPFSKTQFSVLLY